jgi:hypothetical protein
MIVRGELRLRSPTVCKLFFFANYDEHLANTGERSRSLPEFARIRVEFATNWRTVRQKMFSTWIDYR